MDAQDKDIQDEILAVEGNEDLTLQQDAQAAAGAPSTEPEKTEDPPPAQEQAKRAEEAERKYIYLRAEFDNYKKRVQKDQAEQAKFANEKLLRELLVLGDDLERALAHSKGTQDPQKITEGIELILKQFLSCLNRQGVVPIESRGKPFDPEYHQAVGFLEGSEGEANQVVEEIQRGYLLQSRVLRPAMVLISQKGPSKAEPIEDKGGLGESIDMKV